MSANRDDAPQPLKLPAREADVTLLQHGGLPVKARDPSQALPPLPDALPAKTIPPRPAPVKAPLDPGPAIMPTPGPNTESQRAGQHAVVSVLDTPQDPAVTLDALEPATDPRDGEAARPAPPIKTIPPGSGVTVPPPGKILRHGPPGALKPTARPLATLPAQQAPVTSAAPTQLPHLHPSHPQQAHGQPPPPAQRPSPAPTGPLLQTEQVVALVLAHRERQRTLDLWSRGLEVAAVLSAVSALVMLPLGQWPSAVVLLLLAVGLAAQAALLRHVAMTSAHVSALLDALSQAPPPSR